MSRRRLASKKFGAGAKPVTMSAEEYRRRAAEYACNVVATILTKVMDEPGVVGQGGGRLMTEERMKQLRDQFANAIYGCLIMPREIVEKTPDPGEP